MIKLLEDHIARVKEDYPNLQVMEQPDGSVYIEIPDFKLPEGWKNENNNSGSIKILVILPVGYPSTKPNGFEAELNLRLQKGQMPTQGCGPHQLNNQSWLHFCWQPQVWDQNRENLWRYLKFIERRFVEIQG